MTIDTANRYSQAQGDGVLYYALVDDEAYRIPQGSTFCGDHYAPYQFSNTDAFFSAYKAESLTAGAINPFIGPGGSPPFTDLQQAQLASDGGGVSIPQVYTYYNAQAFDSGLGDGCTIDNYPKGPGGWPVTIPQGYAGIQVWPTGNPAPPPNWYTSWEGEDRWSVCHGGLPPGARNGSPPVVTFDWSCPGGRC